MYETNTLRPLTTGQLLDTTFSIYRRHFTLFVGLAALPNLVSLGFQLLVIMLRTGKGNPLVTGLLMIFGSLGYMAVYVVCIAFTQAASFFAVSAVHLNEPITIAGAFTRVRGHVLVVLGTTILVFIATGVGFLFLVVPGIFLLLALALSIPAALFENLDPIDAMKRSFNLTDGAKGTIFLVYLLWWCVSIGLGLVSLFLVMGLNGFKFVPEPLLPVSLQVLQNVLSLGFGAIVAPVLTVALTLVYYDQRVRKEAFDLQHMMSVLGTQPPTPQPPQAFGAGIS